MHTVQREMEETGKREDEGMVAGMEKLFADAWQSTKC